MAGFPFGALEGALRARDLTIRPETTLDYALMRFRMLPSRFQEVYDWIARIEKVLRI